MAIVRALDEVLHDISGFRRFNPSSRRCVRKVDPQLRRVKVADMKLGARQERPHLCGSRPILDRKGVSISLSASVLV
jgi:hypothetical protein